MTRSAKSPKIRRKKILSQAKGYYGRKKSCIRVANQAVEKGLQYAYRDRRNKKRTFRNLWIQRINAAVRMHDMVYSQFIRGLILANIEINRKMLSEIAIHSPESFKELVESSKKALTS
ncbi:MAG: 50S ribosomal protein L20 [Sphingobacteriia bacterium]|nr:50S ribosomal protein L20 [Sphingobacteriia bacterium]